MSERMFIKEEKDEEGWSSEGPPSSYSQTYSSSSSVSVSVSVPPTQRVLPTTPSLRSVTGLGLLSGQTSKPETVLDKTKKFLSALVKFGLSVSPSVGASVKKLVFRLATGCLGVPEFLHQLQLQTQCPVRPYVLPFLQSSLPLLVGQIQMLALASGSTPQAYLASHETLLEPPDGSHTGGLEAAEIFHCEGQGEVSRPEPRKRKAGPDDGTGAKLARAGNPGAGAGAGVGLLSPPLFPLYSAQGQNSHQQESLSSPEQNSGNHQEDEWKNIQVMLNCILGMVEKTQSALTILQQRQSEAASVRSTEEAVAEVQQRANLAILEVKQAAVEEIRQARQGRLGEEGSKEGGQCWNCGRTAAETCSGCGLARYCGTFCQHKDWEDHARVCRSSPSAHHTSPPPALHTAKDTKPGIAPPSSLAD